MVLRRYVPSRPLHRDSTERFCWSLLIGIASCAYAWRNTVWDPTKGFPGEGPPSHSDEWPTCWSSDYHHEREHPFVTHAASVLSGMSPGRGPLAKQILWQHIVELYRQVRLSKISITRQ